MGVGERHAATRLPMTHRRWALASCSLLLAQIRSSLSMCLTTGSNAFKRAGRVWVLGWVRNGGVLWSIHIRCCIHPLSNSEHAVDAAMDSRVLREKNGPNDALIERDNAGVKQPISGGTTGKQVRAAAWLLCSVHRSVVVFRWFLSCNVSLSLRSLLGRPSRLLHLLPCSVPFTLLWPAVCPRSSSTVQI